ncbi:MAG: adenosylcobinamide-GDP ribazoletransferase [Clostridia bacterium]|nr:adenosylcobinamide-GDP ribazoletransferase [Clostridia bacterium]
MLHQSNRVETTTRFFLYPNECKEGFAVRRMFSALIIAFSTYSRIPMPQVEWTDANRRHAMCFFPLVGAVVGAAVALWLRLSLALGFGAFLRGAVAATIPLLITGGIHMDGFMDTADALASHQPRERRLEILKDSHTGAFAVMSAAAYLLVSAALYAEAGARDALPLAGVFVLSRALSAATAVTLPGARANGMLSGFTRPAGQRAVLGAAVVFSVLAAVLFWQTGPVCLLCCVLAATLSTWYYRRMALGAFGGVTGDLAGWFTTVNELLLAFCVVLSGKLC